MLSNIVIIRSTQLVFSLHNIEPQTLTYFITRGIDFDVNIIIKERQPKLAWQDREFIISWNTWECVTLINFL